jgi:integrase
MVDNLLTVSELASEWNCSEDFIYRRCRKGHPQFIPHTRLTPRDIRFDRGVIAGYLQSVRQGDNLSPGSAVRGGYVTRNRDRKGTLLKRGKKRKLYLVQWPQGSERLSHKLGWCDEMTRSQAERAKRQFMEKINSHREVAGDSITLARFYQEHFWDGANYKDELLNKRPSTRRDFRWTMDHIWIPQFGHRRMDTVKTADIQKVLVPMIGEGEGQISRRTALKFRAYLSSMLSSALRLEAGVTHNAARGVKLPASQTEKPQLYITPEQAIAIEEQLVNPRHRMAWKLMLWAGNRCGEIRGLHWRSVHWEQNTILVTESVWEGNSTQPKTKRGYRKVILTPTQIAELKKYKDDNYPSAGPDDWLFPGRGKRPMDMHWFMSEHIKPVAEKLGIQGIHWHALRHLNNSLMLNEGVDVATRMDRLGHVSDRVNLIYSHSEDQAQVAASQAIERRLDAARADLHEKRKAGSKAPLSLLSVTLTVTPNQGLPVSP